VKSTLKSNHNHTSKHSTQTRQAYRNDVEYELEIFAMNSSLTISKPPQRSKKNGSRQSLNSTTMDPGQHAQTYFFALNGRKQLA